ncbi:MAG: hypothetical protein HYS25_15800 [Ignavibacteriales bacterium]|nr:hypothetical protein [Ignavibacteriales bacterium]
MKKGCFLSAIIFLTIAISVGLYLYKKYGHEIKNFGKEKIIEMSRNEIGEKIDELETSKYQDSLKIFLTDEMEKLHGKDFETAMKRFGIFADQIKSFIDDGVIDSVEFTALKNMADKNERPKKN